MSKGRFITLEGGEGVGKSTNLGFISEFLQRRGKRVLATREPGGTPVGEKIRSIFLGDVEIAPETELLLVFAARAQHLCEIVLPALESGIWVVSDRFTDASYAYQGGGRQVDPEFILSLEDRVQKGLAPDLTLLFDAPLEVGMSRAKRRGPSDRMEAETSAFYGRVRETYLQRARCFPERITIIDAARPLEEVQESIAILLDDICKIWT